MFRTTYRAALHNSMKNSQIGPRHRLLLRLSLRLAVFLLLGYVAGAGPYSTYAQQPDPPSKRWAIICSPKLQSMGVSDLLTAKLSEVSNLDLVERDLIDRIGSELELVNFSDPSNIKDRLKIGRQVNADLLAIISTEKSTNPEILRVIVCECQLGTRLSDNRINLTIETNAGQSKTASVGDIAKICESRILRTRRRFADGIQRIIGVPPFQSQNLTHRWDRYQIGFQNVLQSALLAYPGVAVVEIEEARAIKRELARKSDLNLEQSAVILVSGSFQFETSKVNRAGRSEKPPKIKLHVDVNRRGNKAKESPKSMTLDKAKIFLTKTLPKKLVAKDAVVMDDSSEFSQLRWLEEQSTQFFRRGEWQHSAALCEAALLLEPKNVEVRLRLIRCYLNICSAISLDVYTVRDSPLDDPRLVADVNEREQAYLTYLSHLEYLIRNRLVTAQEATNWIRTTRHAFVATADGGGSSEYLIQRYKEVAARLESAEQSFLRRVKPLVLSLDRDWSYRVKKRNLALFHRMENESDLVIAWDSILFKSVTHNISRPYYTATDLDRIFEIMTEEIPEGRPLPSEYWYFFGRGRRHSNERISSNHPSIQHLKNTDHATPQDWQKLVDRLTNSGNESAALVARMSEMSRKHFQYYDLQRKSGAIDEENLLQIENELIAEVEQIRAAYNSLPYSTENSGLDRSEEDPYRQMGFLRKKLLRNRRPKRTQTTSAKPSPKLPPGITKIDYTGAAGVVREFPLKLKSKSISGRISDKVDLYTPPRSGRERKRKRLASIADGELDAPELMIQRRPLSLTRCGDVDVWMTPAKIMIMREKGLLETVLSDRQAFLLDVLWDGKYAWVSTLYDGIKILDLKTGTLSPSINQKYGLPPANADLKIIDIAPGEILAVGSFGKKLRSWCATVRLENQQPVVDVFHQATDPTTNPEGEPDWRDTNLTFLPGWIFRFEPGDGQPTRFLVGRQKDLYYKEHRPLVIDPVARTVSTDLYHYLLSSNRPGGFLSNQDSFLSLDGAFIRIRQGQVRYGKPYFDAEITPAMKKDRGKEFCHTSKGIKFTGGRGRWALPRIYRYVMEDGQIVTAGMQWYKLDPKTLEEKRYVSPDPNSVLKSPQDWGVSAHYGLIGWDGDDETSFRQYVLEDTPKEP